MKLYDNLMQLCKTCDKMKFFYTDVVSGFGTDFRIFSYNYASYTDWCEPDALECRGIMFEIKDGKPVRIASRPMEKFFNLNETPFTMNLDLDKIVLVTAKEDGSLISTYLDAGRLNVKSKGSIASEQAIGAYAWLRKPEQEKLHERATELAKDGYTLNFEYVSPENRIVLPYQERNMILLNIRHTETGEYVPYAEIFKDGVLRQYLVKGYDLGKKDIEDIRKSEDIEGFIFELESGLKFKLKTEWYCALHHTKDSINKNDRLFETIVAGGSDDLKGMFFGDQYAIDKINTFENIHLDYLREGIIEIERLWNMLAGKDRKDFATIAQNELKESGKPELFGVLMGMYQTGLNHDALVPGINKFFLKNHKQHIPTAYQKERVIVE